jgi:hypothetical protein
VILPQRLHVAWRKNPVRPTLAGDRSVALPGFTTYYFRYAA